MNKSSAITPPKINQAAGITYFYFLCQKDGLKRDLYRARFQKCQNGQSVEPFVHWAIVYHCLLLICSILIFLIIIFPTGLPSDLLYPDQGQE